MHKSNMFQKIFFSFLLFVSTTNAFVADLSKVYIITCRSGYCIEGLQACISNNCLGARQCRSVIESFYPTCTRCVDDILDQNSYELVNGNYHLVCNPNDDMQVKACLYYCRVYYYPFGECVRQNNVLICRCSDEDNNIVSPITTTSIINTGTTSIISTTSTTNSATQSFTTISSTATSMTSTTSTTNADSSINNVFYLMIKIIYFLYLRSWMQCWWFSFLLEWWNLFSERNLSISTKHLA